MLAASAIAVGDACGADSELARTRLAFTKAGDIAHITDPAERLLREAYRRLGVSLSFTAMPIERGIVEANVGHYDGLLGTTTPAEVLAKLLIRPPDT